MLKGIDISKWQRGLNLNTLKANNELDFVIMKATEGIGYADPELNKFRSDARNAGLVVGFYHFARPDLTNSAVGEANWFLSAVSDVREGEILVLDYEPSWNVSSETQVAWCLDFLRAIESKIGYKPMIYLNGNQNRTMDWSSVVANGNGLWLATYPYNTPDFNNPPVTDWPFLAMWQYTSSGRLNGYGGPLDLNVFYGDLEQLKKYGIASTLSPTPLPQPEPPKPQPIPEPVAKPMTYAVKKGDTLSGIGIALGYDWKLIYEMNKATIGNNPNILRVGQVLQLPNSGSAPTIESYTVKSGDSLSSIAGRYGTTWQNLYALNKGVIGNNPNIIKSGQVLRLK